MYIYVQMNFKQWFEAVEDLFPNIEQLPQMSSDEIDALLNQRNRGHDNLGKDYENRQKFVRQYSWSIPAKEAIDAIKKWARPPIYDIMAGSGYWTKLLNQAGIKTYAYDLHKVAKHNPYKMQPKHAKIKRRHALEVTRRFNKPTDIILSWPPYDEPLGNEILKTLPIGSRVFYFGEGWGGATGDDAMHANLNKNFKNLEEIDLPKFAGLYDRLYIYEKVANEPFNQNESI